MALFTPAWKKDPISARKAVETMTSQAQLARVVRETYVTKEWRSVKLAAVSRLTDQAALADIAKTDIDRDVRAAALVKLSDQRILADLAKDTGFSDNAYSLLVGNLTDQALLAEVVRSATNFTARQQAIGKLTDQRLLAEYASSDKDVFVRLAAAKRLTDHALAQRIFADLASNEHVGPDAIEYLTDQVLLADIARTSGGLRRRAAVSALTDEGQLTDILLSVLCKDGLSSFDKEARADALEKVDSPQLLVRIVEQGVGVMRKDAIEKLTDCELLSAIANSNDAEQYECTWHETHYDERYKYAESDEDYYRTITMTHTIDLRQTARDRLTALQTDSQPGASTACLSKMSA